MKSVLNNSRINIVEENVSSTKDNSLDNLQVKTSAKNSIISKISTNVDQSKDNEVLSGNLFSSVETSTFKFKVSKTTQVIKSDTKKGSIGAERKTFSLEANTEDIQNINDNITVNTEDALTLIFNQCNRRPNKLGIEKTALLNSKENIVCTFVKPLKLLPRSFRRSLISNPEPVLFFLKGSLDTPKIVHKDVGIQCTLIKNNKETILKQTANVQTQTEEIQLNFNNVSSCNKNDTENNLHKTGLVKEINVYKDIRNESQEHNKIEYIGYDLMSNTYTKKCNSSLRENAEDTEDILEVTNDIHKRFNQKSKEKSLSPSYDLPDETLVAETSKPEILLESDQIENVMGILKEKYSCHDDEFEETTIKNQGDTSKSSKRKREEKEIDEREINIPASGGNTSFSSDSDIQSCLRPVKSVQLPDMSDDEMVMDENMTVKFISMQDSENDDTNIIKKRKVQQLISSGSSSMKENKHNNPLEEDSEPMDYDDILSTVFANIDAELNTGSKKVQDEVLETRKENPHSKVKSNTPNKEYSSNRSPMKQILSKNIQKPAILCSSTPKINSKSNNSAERRSLEISINTLDKTADLDKIVSAIECDYMQKELDTLNQTDILSELQRNMCRSETENERSQIPQSLFRSSLVKQGPYSKSRRSLIYQDFKQNKSPQIMFKSPKDTLNETISTIVDYPKENTEPFISSLSKTNTEPVEMEISSSLEQHQNRALMQHTFDVREKNVEIVENTEISETRLEPEIDFVPSSMETKPICLACSCLLQDDIILVKNFADQFNLKFVMQYEDSVTHLIVRVNKENCAERSLKFINAMVSGIWVLNKNWISDSLAKKELLPEYKYEVLDISLEPGPKRNRISLPKSLFINIKVFVIGPFHSTSADEFKLLLKNTGVMIQNSHISAQIVVMDDGEHTKEEIEETYKYCTKPIVDMGWFLDCICRGRLVKITEHLLLPDISEIDLKNYPSQIFQDTERL
ncbi:uncharacterized protein LOC113384752 [Ctenocephalides felis]|uniref:uncharacterized protein LOC113384752 n=1 Tax=Ctenocephalides felis TaxID=7515 RepID=UPI000E6E34C8|nr:uncharacterized protein LOC113384752 [Ctenocephalides felis]